jgi:hypothetical protein
LFWRSGNLLSSLDNALAELTAKMETQAAAEIANGLAAALENPQETDSYCLPILGSALAALAAKMEPQAAAEIANGFAAALENPQETDSYRLRLNSNKGTKCDIESRATRMLAGGSISSF